MKTEIKSFNEYSKTLPIAREIVNKLLYPKGITSSQEFADRCNKVGVVNRLIQNNKTCH